MTSFPETLGSLTMARRVLAPYVEQVLKEGDHASRFRTLELLARIDPKRVLALIEARGVDDAWLADHLRHAASCHLVEAASGERMAIVETIRDVDWRVIAALDAAGALPESARALKRRCIEQALRDSRSIEEPSRRALGLARVADRLIDLGDLDQAARVLEETRPIVESLPLGQSARAEFAEIVGRVDPTQALALTEEVIDPAAFDRSRIKIARSLASRDPARAAQVLETLKDPRSLARALPEVAYALALSDPNLARRLIDRPRAEDPSLPPYALGMMALAVSKSDKPTAKAWLLEAFDRLARLSPGAARDPSSVAAALLPVAEAIDSKLVPELFWRAISLQGSRTGDEGRADAVLALLLARYDRGVALRFYRPACERAMASHEGDLGPVLVASALLDPDQAVRLVDSLPEPAHLTYHHPKNEARLTLAAALARGTRGAWDDAVARYLQLWTVPRSGGE